MNFYQASVMPKIKYMYNKSDQDAVSDIMLLKIKFKQSKINIYFMQVNRLLLYYLKSTFLFVDYKDFINELCIY